MLDVYDLLEGYCHLLVERVSLFEEEKGCPDELVEAVSSLIHAASRCGDFPEIQEIRKIFTSHLGKEFTTRAVELRNNCRVNPKMIHKLSTRIQRTESKMKVLREIALENNVVLQLEEYQDSGTEDQKDSMAATNTSVESESVRAVESFPDSVNFTGKYRDVAHAAQAAFESAAYAAAAARVAVELSRSEPTDHDSTHGHPRKASSPSLDEHTKTEPNDSETLGAEKFKKIENASSSYLADDNVKELEEEGKIDSIPLEIKVVFDETDDEDDQNAEGRTTNHNTTTIKQYPSNPKPPSKHDSESPQLAAENGVLNSDP